MFVTVMCFLISLIYLPRNPCVIPLLHRYNNKLEDLATLMAYIDPNHASTQV